MQVLTRRVGAARKVTVAPMPIAALTTETVARAAADAALQPFAFALYRLDEPDGLRIDMDAAAAYYPASMIKTPLALAAYTLVQEKKLALDSSFEVAESNMTTNDKPSPLVPGYRSPLSELIDLMITRSDNVATNMLYDIVDRDRATEIVQQRYGLTNTAFRRKLSGSLPLIHDPKWDGVYRNTHPVSDAARLFELIARERVPFAYELRRVLERQEWNNKLSEGLLRGDRFAHKTGDTDEVTHDGGILETADGKSYAIVLYSGMESNDENNAKFGDFMVMLRSHL
jgi:beta-lactamase class A